MVLAEPPTEKALWRHYEESVQRLVASLDSQATVRHDVSVEGKFSRSPRQVDVLVEGKVGGFSVTLAIECKLHTRELNVMTIDGFVGKLLDVEADRGVIYSHSGFTESAVRRARNASNPGILAVAFRQDPAVSFAQPPASAGYMRGPDFVSRPVMVSEVSKGITSRFVRTGEW